MGNVSFEQLLLDAYNKPDPNPYPFDIGQKVRLRKGRSNDGQTPRCWDGAICEVVRRYATGIGKYHWYILRHLDNGATSEFEEDEIDARYARWKGKTSEKSSGQTGS